MADLKKTVPENAPGEFFVDMTCIDCDTCRQLAPETFDDAGEHSYVRRQPVSAEQSRLALQALLSCPTGSIGTKGANAARDVMTDFPLPVAENVYYCGFNSPKSFGGSSYFIRRNEGNWLIDSPKFLPHLARQFQEWGGVRSIFLTHSDDVGDVHKYAEEFQARRIIHREELWSQPESEMVIDGEEPVDIEPDFTVIPTPGHTRGHCVLLYQNRFLFTGDHLWWERDEKRLAMPSHYYWNKSEMAKSSQKLLNYAFEWVLPGHGQCIHLSAMEMRRELEAMIQRSTHGYTRSGI